MRVLCSCLPKLRSFPTNSEAFLLLLRSFPTNSPKNKRDLREPRKDHLSNIAGFLLQTCSEESSYIGVIQFLFLIVGKGDYISICFICYFEVLFPSEICYFLAMPSHETALPMNEENAQD